MLHEQHELELTKDMDVFGVNHSFASNETKQEASTILSICSFSCLPGKEYTEFGLICMQAGKVC